MRSSIWLYYKAPDVPVNTITALAVEVGESTLHYIYIIDCESLCLSDETVKAVGPFYLVYMPGEVKDPTQGVNV